MHPLISFLILFWDRKKTIKYFSPSIGEGESTYKGESAWKGGSALKRESAWKGESAWKNASMGTSPYS